MKTRRFLSIFLTLGLLISMFTVLTATAARADRTRSYRLKLSDSASKGSKEEGWDWDADTKTLTLNGLDLNTQSTPANKHEYGIYIECDATIYIKGRNTITLGKVDQEDGMSVGIFVDGDCLLLGDSDSQLNVFSGNASDGTSYALSAAGDITFQSDGSIFLVAGIGGYFLSDSIAVATTQTVEFKSGKTYLSTAGYTCLTKSIIVEEEGVMSGSEEAYVLDFIVEPAIIENRGKACSFVTGYSRKLARSVTILFPDANNSTADAPSAWAKNDVAQAVTNKILPDSLQGAYQTPITRGEFCQLIAGYIKAKSGKTITEYCKEMNAVGARFADVSENSEEILGIASLGIITGFPDGTFKPDAVITRQDAAIILARLAIAMGAQVEAAEVTFIDAASISEYAKPGVAYVSSLAIMNGNADGSFAPKRNITREQAIITVMNAWRVIS